GDRIYAATNDKSKEGLQKGKQH
ncbi:uncharacterized protein METZ01_LOCUS490056, partial [marine metagenome]